ncbi:MAG: PilN domain-containing protein [candidate division NC10 bacterium]|nr:PilN domain-containing protein [candidate division NC10 bacterium]
MIKINLLPQEERKKTAPPSATPFLIGLGVAVLVGLMGYGWYWLSGEVEGVQKDIERTQAELKRVEDITKLVDKLQKDKKTVQDKLKTVETLVAAQSGPVRLLDVISRSLPGEVWLSGMVRAGKKLDISGFAFSPFSVATFMTNLSGAKELVNSVDLVVSEKAVVETVPVERFSLTMDLKEGKS